MAPQGLAKARMVSKKYLILMACVVAKIHHLRLAENGETWL
jgi:hypothetical protein